MNTRPHLSRLHGAALVAVVAMAVYGNTLGHAFTWDDTYNVVSNEAIRDLGNLPSLWTEPWGGQADDPMSRGINTNYWRPVVLTHYALEHALFGLSPAVFHGMNVLWHGVASVLVWLLAVRLFPNPGPRRFGLLFGALAFAVHPLHTEVVNVVTYRTDLLAAVGTLGSLVAWLGASPERRSSRGVYLWAPLLYALGVGSKEMAVVVPGLVFLLDLWFPPRPLRLVERARRLAPMVGVFVAYMGIRATLLEPSAYSYFGDEPGTVVAATMLGVFGLYCRLLVLPWPLNPFYDWSVLPFETSWLSLAPMMGLCLLMLWCAIIVWCARRRPGIAFCMALFLVCLSPVSQVVPVVVAAAERFLYVALAGPMIAIGVLASGPSLTRLHRPLGLFGLVVLLAWSGLTVTRNGDWRTDRAILEAYVADWPESFNGWIGLARLHEREGRHSEAATIYRKIGREEDANRAEANGDRPSPSGLPTGGPGANPTTERPQGDP